MNLIVTNFRLICQLLCLWREAGEYRDLFRCAPTSEQLLIRDMVAGKLLHVEEAISKLAMETLTTTQKHAINLLTAALKTLFFRTVHKAVNSPEFISRFSDVLIDNSGIIAPLAAHFKSKQRELVTEQPKMKHRCHTFVETRIKIGVHPVPVASEVSYQPATHIFMDETSPLVYSILTLTVKLRQWIA